MTSSLEKIICRACLCDEPELLKPFLENPNILQMYINCTFLQVDANDGLPMNLCTTCIQKCTDWFSFKQLCTNNESILKDRLNIPIPTEISQTTITNEIYVDEFNRNSDEVNDKDDDKECHYHKESVTTDKLDNKITKTNQSISKKTNNTVYECAECGDEFKNKFMINRHIRRKHIVKKFDCSECGKLFQNRAKRLRHMRSHTGEKPFKCTVCDKLFSSKDYIRVHMRNHTGEKPFLCTLCGESFRQKSSLHSHYLTHTDKKPYACMQCDKTYKTKAYLAVHIKSHQK